MSRQRRFDPAVYVAVRRHTRGSNREIARLLGVDEASVRRGLQRAEELRKQRKRAADRAALLTDRGRARARRFRLNEQLKRMKPSKEKT